MWWKWLIGLWITAGCLAALLLVPEAQGFRSYRIVYFHVPAAWVAVIAFLCSALYSIRYLRFRKTADDLRAASAGGLGLLFCVLATVTGAVFSKMEWGQFWNWDPRQTTIFVLLLIYGAYFALRSAVPDEERRGALCAVYALFAFVSGIFLVFIIPRIVYSLHPQPLINLQGTGGMDPKMTGVLLWNVAGFTGLYGWMFQLSVKAGKLERKLRKEE